MLAKDVIDLEYGTNLKIVYKNRTDKRNGMRRVGGGVSVIFNKATCSFKERKMKGNGYELVAAVGRVGKIARPVAIFCIYVEPRMKVGELGELHSFLADQVLSIKTSCKDPLILVGGDINRRDLSPAFGDFLDIVRNNFEPTRRDACLDVLFSNLPDVNSSMWPPLSTDNGIRSDHDCVLFNCRVERVKNFTWVTKKTRKHTEAACVQFEQEFRAIDWCRALPDSLSADEMVSRFEQITGEMTNRLFPEVTVRCRSNDAPWVTNGIRRLSKRKARVYKREGKSRYWFRLQDKMQDLTARSKGAFVGKVRGGGMSSRAYVKAVKTLGSGTPPVE